MNEQDQVKTACAGVSAAIERAGWIAPDWPAPTRVCACTTTRAGGVSRAPYDSLNLADHVGDDPVAVQANRERLCERLALPGRPRWLRQVHGSGVVDAGAANGIPEADGGFTTRPGEVCAVLTADCLPVLLCDRRGSCVAALHAGWRGLAAGVIEAALDTMRLSGEDVLAWLGPAIGPQTFEVGEDVRQAFVGHDEQALHAFRPSPAGRWLADLYQLARRRLAARGVVHAYGGGYCTYKDRGRFYSYRRDRDTGRMATLIWIQP